MSEAPRMFVGRPIYWLLVGAILLVLAALGLTAFHVREFVIFQFIVLGLAVAGVVAVVLLHRPGERITREPLD